MRLKKIKLAGFKSFVEPTTIPFPGEMTAVVGPNGCGKSNVIDAVRWVLGESSAKNLRGDAMTDVIFNGSSNRKPVGQCSVELVFDNTSNRIGGEYAKYNELSVKRLVTRDATSTYFLNGTKCRRRDVTDLFLGTGLGPRSYAIIEQGMISRLIESKPQELRVFIEEAAGISKYKERRRETENRIKHTQDNLERLNDVRDELGKQLEKLQRQAAAATRYKTLRAKTRELKGQLAAIRFLKNSQRIEALQKQQQVIQLEVDGLNARLQGDEAGVESYKTRHVQAKQSIDDLQQQIFTTGNQITRLEQNALHAKQRKVQVESELTRLNEQVSLLHASIEEAETALSISRGSLDKVVPELEIKEAELEQARERLDDGEQSLREFNSKAREQELLFNQLRQNVQQSHGQIQSLMSMQLRTSQRISELNDEREQLKDDDLNEQLEILEAQYEQRQLDIDNAQATCDTLADSLQKITGDVKAVESQLHNVKGDYQATQSAIFALEALQQDATLENNETVTWLSKLWQQLSIPSDLTVAVEAILTNLHSPVIAVKHTTNELIDAYSDLPIGCTVFSNGALTEKPKAQSLANEIVKRHSGAEEKPISFPKMFNDILYCENESDAFRVVSDALNEKQSTVNGFSSVIAKSGLWLSTEWLLKPGETSDGVLQRANKIAKLSSTLQGLEAQQEEALCKLDEIGGLKADIEAQQQQALLQLTENNNAALQIKNQISLLTMRVEQNAERYQKLHDEIEKQQTLFNEEEAQITQLSATLELQEAKIEEQQVFIENINSERESQERLCEEAKALVEQLVSKKHELALKCQQLENHQTLHLQQVTRNKKQREEYAENKLRLEEELKQLLAPQERQDAELQILLEQKVELEQARCEKQTELEDIEQWLREAEKGHQALSKSIQEKQTAIDKLNIDIEGFRVRANTVIEQLDDSQQSLKTLLEALPQDADEGKWQEELDSVQASLQRLGAVNLAAVEEFDIQSERKNHLDTQHHDLTEALETLQSAIRKIDKETRSRFSATFEQVNEDLKTLFPKVFGGGSAYLALTDDDLLETGVTIMARPPGKKNSTIHLLSGGEKALTALSLVFAIFRLNPAPFCLLDEVDAPLDDANVGRFCNLVSEMSQTVQFIYITHNKIAMEMASHLTGVTMAEPGVSRMVAVDVDEAVAFAEA